MMFGADKTDAVVDAARQADQNLINQHSAAAAASLSNTPVQPAITANHGDEDDSHTHVPTAFMVTWKSVAASCAEMDDSDTCASSLCRMVQQLLPASSPFYFSCIPHAHRSVIEHWARYQNSRGINGRLVWSESGVWELPTPVASALMLPSLPSGVTIGPLREQDAQVVYDTWHWASSSSLELVRHLIRNYITRCVYVDDVPACWCLEQTYHCIGMLHTEPQFRHRGFAALCVQSMCHALIDQHRTPYCYIISGNEASEQLFTRLGFQRVDKVWWTLWMPRHKSKSNMTLRRPVPTADAESQ